MDEALAQRVERDAPRDANNLISQARTWQRHNVGDTPGFGGDHERALRSIKAQVLYMPCETDLYFPIGDARYESRVSPARHAPPDPVVVGALGRRRRQSGRQRLHQRRDSRLPSLARSVWPAPRTEAGSSARASEKSLASSCEP